ncbi:orotidine 5'-phosphate decarboxylase [Candidatus Woesearchaeota archaeon]|nr:orotidine 5'-phosphate decarboxylase [Candidatus Woesearchaeota archaeon]
MIVSRNRSVIPACDVDSLDELKKIVKNTCSVEGIGAYKVGFSLVIPFGMEAVVKAVRDFTDLPVIYDHQKAGTDIPDTGSQFMRACRKADAVIIFPQAGPATEDAWIRAAKEEGVALIVGGEMTHKAYLESEDGFLSDSMPKRAYEIAARLGVKDFVVPGNRPEKIVEYRKLIESFTKEPVFYSPGMITQGGSLTDGAKAAGKRWHAIVGRALYQAKDMEKTAKEMVKCL